MNEERALRLGGLLRALKARRYHFITPTPATHARVIARPDKQIAHDLRDVFGWSLPFACDLLDAEIFEALEATGALELHGDLFKSKLRASSLDDDLFLHSAYPTTQVDSVFFGPDSYRFAAFLKAEVPKLSPPRCIVDMGAGTGVGAFTVQRLLQPNTPYAMLVDVNPIAGELIGANLHAMDRGGNWAPTDFACASRLTDISATDIDLIIANPPYIADPLHRAYRDGGDMHGAALSLDWARQAMEKLPTGGVLLLYTGSAIVGGEDRFKTALLETLAEFDVSYRELDPDVFGEELERADYADVERIAVVGVVAVRR